jgi:RNA polymerase sigma factor (sigma-70 family)
VEDHAWLAYRMAWRFARRHARDVPADELIAEALLALTYAAGRFRPDCGVPFLAYASMVLRHWLIQAVLRWRRGQRAGRLPTVTTSHGEQVPWEAEARPAPDPCAGAAAREMCDRVRRVLPARLYRVLRLYHGEGRSLGELAEHFQVTRQRILQMIAEAEGLVRKKFPHWVGN